ncbi:MAG: PmoA family protein [Acidobacteria bacterium]|nr:PmoA family protein [Acidobacteriota bacterium]
MKNTLLFACLLTALATISLPAQTIKLVDAKEKKQVDVLVDGQPFTSYVYWDNQKKPILYPLRTSKGTTVTRGYPLEKVAGERTDHPHHISSWFNYGNINGVDFWNTPPEGVTRDRGAIEKFGTIKHTALKNLKSGKSTASLDVSMDWLMPDGAKIMQEDDQIFFRAANNIRIVDRVITLTAQKEKVVFNDSKEGALGIRVTRTLEEPTKEPLVFTDQNGVPTTVKALDNTGVAGVYLSSEGKVGEKEGWGTRAKWMTLSGTVKGEDVVIGIFDHPKNPTYPTYWHARGYGLFAANPFGAKEFTKGATTLNYTLQPGQSVTLRFRILIHSGKLTKEQTEALYQQFLKDVTQ